MAYNTKELEKQALKAIEEHNLVFINELPAYIPISRPAIYQKGLDKLDTIRKAIDKNKIHLKKHLRDKWYNRDHPTTDVVLYKLVSDDYEFGRITQQQVTGADGKSLIEAIEITIKENSNGKATDNGNGHTEEE